MYCIIMFNGVLLLAIIATFLKSSAKRKVENNCDYLGGKWLQLRTNKFVATEAWRAVRSVN